MDEELRHLVAVYRTEAAEHIASMEQALLALEARGAADAELLNALLRSAHTLKGNSAIVGYDAVARAAHVLEDALEQLRDGTTAFTPELVSDQLEALDGIRRLLRAESEPAAPSAPAARSAAEPTLRVNVARLDALLSLTGEITIARGRLVQLLGAAPADAALGATLWQLEQLHAALQGEVMRLRMVPLGPMLRQHHRTVRDARQRGREARLLIEGDDVAVDTSIAEQMRDPVTHMIRNAVDHGIEPAAERLAAGKAAEGTVSLRATQEAGAVVLELSDDGRGLDRARIAERARALGLVTNADTLPDDQLLACIFEPGFSTATEVTEISGRGVGMDVVRRNIRALRGTIAIASTPGRGTTFTIRLPLTVAILDGFTVRVGEDRYVLPLDAVVECVDFASAQARGDRDFGVLDLRGTPLPYLRLGAALGVPPGDASRTSVVVVRHGGRRAGLVVDALEGDGQAVIKPLDGGLRHLPGVSGATILGNGRVALILSVPQLIERAAPAATTVAAA